MNLGEIDWGCGMDSTGSGLMPVAGCCECGDEPSGFGSTEVVSYLLILCGFHVVYFTVFFSLFLLKFVFYLYMPCIL
jgi:hypothetical protein